MSTFWQVFLAVIAAWLVIQIALRRFLNWAMNSRGVEERLKTQGAERIATATADELEKRALVR